jgi:hypothetical protein
MKKSIIGKLYCPKDNSYIERLDNGASGMLFDVWCKVISEPYLATSFVSPIDGKAEQDMFVNVESEETGVEYRVLFNESWLLNRWTPFEEEEKKKQKEIPKKMLS